MAWPDDEISTSAPVVREVVTSNGRKIYYQWDATTGEWIPAPGLNVYGPEPVSAVTPASAVSQWTTKTDPSTGDVYRVNEATGEKEKIFSGATAPVETDQWQDPLDGSVWIVDAQGNKLNQLSPPIPGWTPGLGVRAPAQAPQRAPRFPEEVEAAQLANEQARRELANPVVLAQQQMNEAISTIEGQIARGEMDPAEGQRMIGLARANLSAVMQGTTPWQMEQAKQQIKSQRQGLARDVLSDQLTAGSNMAQGLLSGMGGIYGKILQSSGPPTNFNPLDVAKAFTQDMGGGPELGEMARSILLGALGGQGG